MTTRTRRWLAVAAALVLLLLAGRWVVAFLAARWWAAALAPGASAVVTRWHLLGLLLDVGAIVIASCWFAGQALLVARAIGSVQVERRIGELRVREAVPTRLLIAGAVATGVMLGLLTGAGARAWRAPLALAWQGVHYGVTDPLLGVDLGILVAQYPVWRLAHQFALTLVLLGLAFATILYAGIGAIRRRERRFELHPDARRHLGGLLALLGLLIAVGYLLAPYRLAVGLDVPLAPAAATTRVLAAQAAAGAAIAVAVMSFLWALRPRHSMLGAGWAVLALAAVGERVIVPAFVAEGGLVADRDSQVRRLESLFYGMHVVDPATPTDSLPVVTALWDEASFATWSASRHGTLLAATPTIAPAPGWLVATGFPDAFELTVVTAGTVGPGGVPQSPPSDSAARPIVHHPRVVPGHSGWRPAENAVRLGGPLRRLALAWALQAPGILGVTGSASIDWELDPRDRIARLMPGLHWRTVGLTVVDGEPTWLVSGLATISHAPLTTRVTFEGDEVAGVVPALMAAIRAGDGGVRVFVDPSADSLGRAWAAVYRPMVEPDEAMPAALRSDLPYPGTWLECQLEVLEHPTWGLGHRPTGSGLATSAPSGTAWEPTGPVLQAMLEDPSRGAPATLIEASRRRGVATLSVDRLEAHDGAGGEELGRTWSRAPGLARLRDSVRAAGDTLLAGPVRWQQTTIGLAAWQPFRSGGRRGSPAVLWIGTARAGLRGGGRRPADAWGSLDAGRVDGSGVGAVDASARLEAIRGWILRADSALARRDMTAFGRAWEALRGLLVEPSRE